MAQPKTFADLMVNFEAKISRVRNGFVIHIANHTGHHSFFIQNEHAEAHHIEDAIDIIRKIYYDGFKL